MQNCAQILRWTAWAPGMTSPADWAAAAARPAFGLLEGEFAPADAKEPAAPAAGVPAMLRRRLSPLGRALAEVLAPLAAAAPDAPWVYASRRGDAGLAVEMLTDVAADRPLSPAKFAMSVHNGPASLLSIALKHRGNLTALAGGPFSAEVAFESAVGLLAQHEQVILTVADVKPPVAFEAGGVTHAWGLLLSRAPEPADPAQWDRIRAAGPLCALTTRALADDEAPDPRLNELGGVPGDLDVLAWLLRPEERFLTRCDRHAAWVWAKEGGLSGTGTLL
ncbi:beta-ketoacyl synthase chain length factor [Sutterella sp.]|uniref:beta-ketoacyl synthase chain length factor n=1 Tax=Sutterella sp. TaxID=1981025 RepID=UPI0026DEDE67|nr:beta-ketoacyl synthase chain length factor [Sutterella sp.]MDO5530945.1 beta-ketoacyl synthase chain length factor [Sutterella sp.]